MSVFPINAADPAKVEKQLKRPPPVRRYCMLFTPRSGSSWVTSIAQQTEHLGVPGEYFNPTFVPNIARHFGVENISDYIDVLTRKKNINGTFGFKVTYFQLIETFSSEQTFMDFFGDDAFFWLIREDIVLQAVSLMKMQQTQIGHSSQADKAVRAKAEELFVYDEDSLKRWLRHIREIERRTEKMLERYALLPRRMSYERNVSLTASGVTKEMARVIGVGEISPIQHQELHQKIATHRNSEFAVRFREANRAEIAELEDERSPMIAALREASPSGQVTGHGYGTRMSKHPFSRPADGAMRLFRSILQNRGNSGSAVESRSEPTGASKAAPWLRLLNDGTFPIGNDPIFNYGPGQIPLPNEVLRQTVSRPDLAGFYFIGESWALSVLKLLSRIDRDRYDVLDMGCGVGKTARFLALDSRIHYTGFDIFEPAIDWCRNAFRAPVGDRFRFVHFDGVSKFYNPAGTVKPADYEFPVEDGSIDVAFAASLFTHLLEDDMRAYLCQCAKKLAPDGFALLSIKESLSEASEGMTGTEQSIIHRRDFFVSVAAESGLRLQNAAHVIAGQRALVFLRS